MRKTFDSIILKYVVLKKTRVLEFIFLLLFVLTIWATMAFIRQPQDSAGYFNLFEGMFVLMGSTLMFGCCLGSYRKEDLNFTWFSTILIFVAIRAFLSSLILCAPKEFITIPAVSIVISFAAFLSGLGIFVFLVGYIRVISRPEGSTGNSFILALAFNSIVVLSFFVYSVIYGKIFVEGPYDWLFSFIPGNCILYLSTPVISGLFAISYLVNATEPYIKKRNKTYITYIIVYLFALIIQIPMPYSLSSIASYFLMCLLYNDQAVKTSRALVESEREITTQRMDIMRSQIQPHFIFNALNTICYLCRKDPVKAESATKNFASYLRMNIDSIGSAVVVPFSRELQHVKTYLELEQLRFGDKVKVEYDIEFTDFNIPPLALQPMVENSVKHGFGKTKTSLLLRISCKKDEDHIVIKVIDNGVGFNMEKVDWDSGTHIGVQNVKERIQRISKGTFDVYSLEGTGTMTTIKLPLSCISQTGGEATK